MGSVTGADLCVMMRADRAPNAKGNFQFEREQTAETCDGHRLPNVGADALEHQDASFHLIAICWLATQPSTGYAPSHPFSLLLRDAPRFIVRSASARIDG
jgi:hypothetical protein